MSLERFKEDLLRGIASASSEANKETGKEVLKQKESQFKNRGSNEWDETQFPALSPTTIQIKDELGFDSPDMPLVRTGHLSESLYLEDEDNFTSIKSRDVENDEGVVYNAVAKAFITNKSGGEPHYYDELSEAEQKAAFANFFENFLRQLKVGLSNGS